LELSVLKQGCREEKTPYMKERKKENTSKTQAQMGDNIKIRIKKQDRTAWTGLIWLRIRTNGQCLRTKE
jgi:hypothetical protein